MDMKYYQQAAITTAKPSSCNLYYMALDLAGEAGEVANKVKKIMRDNDYPAREDIKAELGDVLWYIAGMATVLGIDLGDIAAANLTKLQDRQRRGVIGVSGDNR